MDQVPRALVQPTRTQHDLAALSGADAGDVHVVAAALATRADVLVTQNSKHFPKAWLAGHGIELLTAGALLERLADNTPDALREAHQITVTNSPKSEDRILTTLEKLIGPQASDAVRSAANQDP